MAFNKFKQNVIGWAKDRKIIPNSNNEAQYTKLIEELGELALGIRKQDDKLIKDSVGDIAVVLTILAGLNNIDLVWRYRQTNGGKNFLMLSDKIGSIGFLLLEKKIWGNKFRDVLKGEIKKALYFLADYANEIGIDFYECCELAWNEIKDRKGYLREDGIFIKEEGV